MAEVARPVRTVRVIMGAVFSAVTKLDRDVDERVLASEVRAAAGDVLSEWTLQDVRLLVHKFRQRKAAGANIGWHEYFTKFEGTDEARLLREEYLDRAAWHPCCDGFAMTRGRLYSPDEEGLDEPLVSSDPGSDADVSSDDEFVSDDFTPLPESDHSDGDSDAEYFAQLGNDLSQQVKERQRQASGGDADGDGDGDGGGDAGASKAEDASAEAAGDAGADADGGENKGTEVGDGAADGADTPEAADADGADADAEADAEAEAKKAAQAAKEKKKREKKKREREKAAAKEQRRPFWRPPAHHRAMLGQKQKKQREPRAVPRSLDPACTNPIFFGYTTYRREQEDQEEIKRLTTGFEDDAQYNGVAMVRGWCRRCAVPGA